MLAKTAGNDPFFERAVMRHYQDATRRHAKLPILPALKYGVATNVLPATFEGYFRALGKTARQNIRKAQRCGYEVVRINYNDHLDQIAEINRSAPVRQGPMPEVFLSRKPEPIPDPPSRTNVHDYVYFAVFKNGRLAAYGGCLVAGEAMIITIIYGHADHLKDGVVPLLLSGMAAESYNRFPHVRYFIYDKYFGGSDNIRRFKRKFGFLPHTVHWML